MYKKFASIILLSILPIALSACASSNLTKEQQLVSSAMDKNVAGKMDEAMVDLNQAIEINPNFGDAYLIRGMTILEIGKDKPAGMADLDKSIQLNPKVADGYFQKGLYQLEDQLGTKEEACANLTKAIDLGMPEAKEVYSQDCN